MTEKHPWSRLPQLLCLLCLGAAASSVLAQSPTDNPDWHETQTPAPPTFSSDKLLPLDMPPYVTLQFGIDPATLSITADGIVRYVVVARNASGSVSAFYEGILCAKGEVKTYARTQGNAPWRLVTDPQWRGLNDNQPSKHALAFARQGACDNTTTANSVADIIRAMKK